MKLAFDMAAFMWRALLAGKDKEYGRHVQHEDKAVWVNSAQYGYDLTMNMMLDVMKQAGVTPYRCILVFEGMHSKKRRQAIESTYKGNRDSRPIEAYQEYEKLIVMLESAWLGVGAASMRQSFVEGDDVLAYLAEHSEDRLWIASFDNDLAALNGKNPQGFQVDVWVDGKVGVNKYGDFDHKLITLYKSLVGDSSDNIKGCPKFGPASWDVFRITYGDDGLQELANLLEAGSLGQLHAQAEDCKLIRLICAEEAQILRSYQLAKMHPEWVNTRNTALEIGAGMVKSFDPATTDGRLSPWAGVSMLVTSENFGAVAEWCKHQFGLSPFVALDIETATPPESDDWLCNQVPPNPDGVDVLGSTLAGLSLTFGNNLQYTVYISVDHADTPNVTSEDVRGLVSSISCEIVIQNLAFELPVLYQEWGSKQESNGYHGFLPNCLDTKLEASYVNENIKNGLKGRSETHLKYKQQTFHETTQFTGPADELRQGGRLIRVVSPRTYYDGSGVEIPEDAAMKLDAADQSVTFVEEVQTRQYKMSELPASHVFGYGCDDTICTAALHNFYRLVMELEHTYQTYLDVEIDAAYMSALGFLHGTSFSAGKMRELVEEDDKTYEEAWSTVRSYLLDKGWEGSVCPVFSADSKPADLKEAYFIVTGKALDTQVRKIDKLAKLMAAEGADVLAALLESGDWTAFNKYVKMHFKGEPDFNIGSPKQKQTLLYTTLGLPIRIRNKPTDQMRAAGVREGTAKTDALAIDWAVKFDAKEEDKPLLHALKLMQMVETRRGLFYSKWPGFVHWKTGRVHSSSNQCEANTRRSSESAPNKQQLGKRAGPDGKTPRFREVIVPHHANAVIVSLDESSQELRLIADYSQDVNMLACFVGESKKDMHSMTGLGIATWKYPKVGWSYEVFSSALKDKSDPLYLLAFECRVLGKTTNFATEYGAMAPKLSQGLLVTEDEAQVFIDAKESAFPGAMLWKDSVIQEARDNGYVRTRLGAVRHLRDALNSNDSYEASKADRQAINYKIQSSSGEQIRKAYGKAWRMALPFAYDAKFVGPVHDEVVWSVGIPDLLPFLVDMHACMVQPYGGMTTPIESTISFGLSFGEQVEIGSLPTEEAVLAGLEKMRGAVRRPDGAHLPL